MSFSPVRVVFVKWTVLRPCDLQQGVPCSDGKHCCPEGHQCSADSRSCSRKGETVLLTSTTCHLAEYLRGVNHTSESDTKCGVPQGSTLGPLLFQHLPRFEQGNVALSCPRRVVVCSFVRRWSVRVSWTNHLLWNPRRPVGMLPHAEGTKWPISPLWACALWQL